MTGGAQGKTGMRIAGSQSTYRAPQVITQSSVFSSTFSSSQPILLFFICYLVSLVHKDIHEVGADPGTQDSVLGPPSFWTEPGIEPDQGHGRRTRYLPIPRAQCPNPQRMSNPKGIATSSSPGCTRSLDGVGEAWLLLVTVTLPAGPRCRGVCMPKPHPHFLGGGVWQ